MNNILEQLYGGELYPAQNLRVKDPEYNKLLHKMCAEKDYFRDEFSTDDRVRFENLDKMYFNASDMYGYANFTYGFRMGVCLMIEALTNGNGIWQEDE